MALRYFASTLKKNCHALRLDAGWASPKPRPATSLFASGRPVSPAFLPPRINAKIWISGFTNRHPENHPFFPLPLLPVKSLAPANNHVVPPSPPTAKSHWGRSQMQPGVSAWHSFLPVKITSMTISCSTGGVVTGQELSGTLQHVPALDPCDAGCY